MYRTDSHAAKQLHFHKPRGGKRQGARKRDKWTERGRGGREEGKTTEMREKKKVHTTGRESWGPKASKVAKGEK